MQCSQMNKRSYSIAVYDRTMFSELNSDCAVHSHRCRNCSNAAEAIEKAMHAYSIF